MNRLTIRLFSVLLSVFLSSCVCMTAVFAADDGGGRRQPAPKKDPVEMAFALPRGMVLTPKELKWASSVRAKLEPQLRDALGRVQNSTDKSEQIKAAKEVQKIRGQVRAAIGTIIQARMVAAAREAARRQAAMRKAMQKRAAQQRKKGGHRKKRGRRR